MNEHPILFSGEMVRAILDGKKIQTRRVEGKLKYINLDPSAWYDVHQIATTARWSFRHNGTGSLPKSTIVMNCAYGMPGDCLYVKEGYKIAGDNVGDRLVCGVYLADNVEFSVALTPSEWARYSVRKFPHRATPGRFMYRSLARITLKVLDVKVERVRDISEGDAEKEGLLPCGSFALGADLELTAYERFLRLWDKINARRGYSWELNPWVWVIEFENVAL